MRKISALNIPLAAPSLGWAIHRSQLPSTSWECRSSSETRARSVPALPMSAGRCGTTSRGVPPAQPAINRCHTFVWAPLCRATVVTAQGEAVRNRAENKQQQEEPEGWCQLANTWQDASGFLNKPSRPFQGVRHPGDDRSQGWVAAEERAGQQRSRATNLGPRWKQLCNTGMGRGYGARAGGETRPIWVLITGHLSSLQSTSCHAGPPLLTPSSVGSSSLWSCSQKHSLSHLNPWSQDRRGLNSEYCLLFRGKWKKGFLVFVIVKERLRI